MSSHEAIAELAYRLWNARGRPHGSEEEDWLEAERQLSSTEPGKEPAGRYGKTGERAIDASLQETFPASDPPASHIPDLPPVNAEDKWRAAGKKPRTSAHS